MEKIKKQLVNLHYEVHEIANMIEEIMKSPPLIVEVSEKLEKAYVLLEEAGTLIEEKVFGKKPT